MAVEVTLNTPLADALSDVVQPKLHEMGWSTGGLDDSALGEYIILMLVNGKSRDQIAAELSNDLLNLEPENSGAIEFSSWLFEQVNILNAQLNGPATSQSTQPHITPNPESHPESGRSLHQTTEQPDNGRSPDIGMTEAMDGVQDGVQDGTIPTGPKSMRNGSNGRNGNRRLIGQLSKAMDRSSDAPLHRVRSQQGTERINMHNRQPPKGPRNDQGRLHRPQLNGRPMAPPSGVVSNGGGPGMVGMPMTAQQQMQLLAMYEEQARVMSQIFSPQPPPFFMPGIPQPGFNPNFQNGLPPQPQLIGRSLFDRVEGPPQRQNGNFGRRPQQNGGHGAHSAPVVPPAETPTKPNPTDSNGDASSPMDIESSQINPPEISTDTVCKFNLSCTKKDCPFAHQSSAAPPGITIDVNDHCPFGAACKNRKCVARHPSPAQKAAHQFEQECRFFPNCTNSSCPFRHPTMPMCRNGADCNREGCKFTHVKIMCKFNPCLNPTCPYKHVEGQKRGVFDDKVWVADGSQEKNHVSERKFVDDETLEEELIIPENPVLGSNPSSVGAEVVT